MKCTFTKLGNRICPKLWSHHDILVTSWEKLVPSKVEGLPCRSSESGITANKNWNNYPTSANWLTENAACASCKKYTELLNEKLLHFALLFSYTVAVLS